AVGRGTGRFGEPFDIRGPENILLTLDHAINVGLETIVILYGYALLIGFRCEYGIVIVFLSPLGSLSGRDKALEPFFLHLMRILHEKLNLMNTLFHDPSEYRIDESHFLVVSL